ncbi:Oligosaccharyltransferase subunit Ribophorin II-domain-containing protein [Amylocarpus encephaloides]|uniref:Oligosaccharyltransferase subunit Ribophorin II-domain-containing protein n=1 Tax=Amylocarpus encephaloides TaxID=45428 RepID=A0A9P8C373_9HELO|nr:Oligosaccharyltransferase subunit Ribophorin II-domain-containing protein [Amylocarpus encephaloides]
MRFLRSLLPSVLVLGTGIAEAASSWNFEEAIVSVNAKGTAGGFKDKLSDHVPLSNYVILGEKDTAKIILTATEDGKPKRPHQVMLLLRDQDTGLEASLPFSLKDNGKGKIDFTQKDLPIQLLTSTRPLRATLIIASFGTSQAFRNHAFDLDVKLDPNVPQPKYEKPLRYGQLGEINHIFRADPKSAPLVISLFFVLAVLATVPILLGTWAYLGANLSHLSKATSAAPISHGLFFASIVSMEGIFLLYYYNWTLFQTLPVAGVVGLVTFLSGSKALSEVQSRRLAGER